MLSIREFVSGEENDVINLILPIQQGEFGVPITVADQPDLATIPAFYQKGKGNFWVAKVDEKIVGTIALVDIGHGDLALRKMFVAEAYRGREFGIAQALLATSLLWAQQRDIERIFLGTTSGMKAAHRFYEKNHFKKIEKEALPSWFPLVAVDDVFYERKLKVPA